MAMTIADYEKNGSEAEKALIEACRKGEACTLGNLPSPINETHKVRADLIRLLMLKEHSLHPSGLQLAGARIMGELDLRFATCQGTLSLERCRFEKPPQLGRCKIAEISLDDSHFPGLFAGGMEVAGHLFLKNITSTRTIELVGANVARSVELDGAVIKGKDECHLLAQSLHVGSILFFRNIKWIDGWVFLASARARDLADDPASWQVCKKNQHRWLHI